MTTPTPHDRLYELVKLTIENKTVVKLGRSFGVPTEAGHVEVKDGGIASLEDLWLRWSEERCRHLYRLCLDRYITSKLPPAPPPPLPPQAIQVIKPEVQRPSLFRRWVQLVCRCFRPFGRRNQLP